MKLTAITCTHERPAAFDLCRTYVLRQTRPADQWLVLDGPEPMQLKVLAAIEHGAIEGDAIVFAEDDDWFRADWFAWCEAQIEKGFELAGEGNIAYYNVRHRWWSECGNDKHAALCQTVLHRDLLPTLANVIKSFDSAFFDLRIWQVECSKRLFMPRRPEDRHLVGIKGITGTGGATGYSDEHRAVLPVETNPDPSLLQLWKWIGADAARYAGFYER